MDGHVAAPKTNLWEEGRAEFVSNLQASGYKQKDIDEFLQDRASFQDARSGCESLKADTEKKYGSLEIAGKKMPTKWIGLVMDNMDRFMQIGDTLVTGAPESVGMAWWAVRQILGGIQNNYKLYGFFGSSLATITDAMVIIGTYDKLYDERKKSGWKASDVVSELLKHIRGVYAAILDFSWSIKKHVKAGGWGRVKHSFKSLIGTDITKYQDKMGSIEDLKAKIKSTSDVAFQEKSFQQSDEMKAIVGDIQSAQSQMIVETRERNQYMMDLMAEIAKSNRPPSRLEWATRKFEDNKKLLHPISTTATNFDTFSDRFEGTCEWIWQDKKFKNWAESTSENFVCIDGSGGTGKSFMLAYLVQYFESQCTEGSGLFVQSITCDALSDTTGGGTGASKLTTLRNTLIAGIYDLVADLDDPALMEKCNEVFNNPKQKKVDNTLEKSKKEDSVPEFDDAFILLSELLGKKVYLFIDAIDRLDDDEQRALAKECEDLVKRAGGRVKLVISARQSAVFLISVGEKGMPRISMNKNNRSDMKLFVEGTLLGMRGWTSKERDLAAAEVIKRAGPYFKYPAQVAIPFLNQPWQRPIENHLRALPEGLGEKYTQFLRGLSANYVQLLRTALTWALSAQRPVTVTEVMEVYTGVYNAPTDETPSSEEAPDLSMEFEDSELYVKQLQEAGGPFLYTYRYNGRWYIKLKDSGAVREFCEKPVEKHAFNTTGRGAQLCGKCHTDLQVTNALSISKKEGHLDVALATIRNLNSPLFQRRYLGIDRSSEIAVNGSTATNGSTNAYDKTAMNGTVANSSASIPSQPSNGQPTAIETQTGQGHTDEDDILDDESLDSEDRAIETYEWLQDTTQDDGAEEEEEETDVYLRYEIQHWWSHARQAGKLLSPEERASNKNWSLLMNEIEYFMIKSPDAYRAWLKISGNPDDWEPIQTAAFYGLAPIVERFLDQGHSKNIVTAEGRNLLHLALWWSEDKSATAKLLLERGVDPNFESNLVTTPFFKWVSKSARVSNIKEFLRYGGSCSYKDKDGYSVLHHLARSKLAGPDLLDLLLDNPEDPSNRADINAKDKRGETPLHKLLSRREVPPALLKAFIKRGADINIDDRDSQRPLYELAQAGDLDAMTILVESGKLEDIDDDDVHGRTALQEASRGGHVEIVKLLLSHGADPGLADHQDRTPLFFACLGRSEETARILLGALKAKGYDFSVINQTTKRKRTPLREAAARGFTSIVQTLMEMDNSPDVINAIDSRKGRSALHCAALRGKLDIVKVLIAQGANTQLKGYQEKTPLQVCAEQWFIDGTKDHERTTSYLIDINPQEAKVTPTVLSAAAANGSLAVVEKLFSIGANLNTPDEYGWTPILLAKRFKHKEVVKFLGKHLGYSGGSPSKFVENSSRIWVSDDGTGLYFEGGPKGEYTCLTTDHPIPAGQDSYYYEVTVQPYVGCEDAPVFALGFSTMPASPLIAFPGWPNPSQNALTWAYHGYDGGIFESSRKAGARYFGKPFSVGDTVGCGVDYTTGTIFWTHNGEKLENTFTDVKGRLFPILGVDKTRISLLINFGLNSNRPFRWLGNTIQRKDSGVGELFEPTMGV